MKRVGRVCAYVTRDRSGAIELLVFEHRDDPSAGTQVPAGGIYEGESPEEALFRELEEEAGIKGARIVRLLSDAYWDSHAFHVVAPGETRDSWEHTVGGAGEDAGMVFEYRWVPLRPPPDLYGSPDPVLDLIPSSVARGP